MQNTIFISFIIKIALVIVKQKIDAIIKNFYFKLIVNNIIFFRPEEFFLKIINGNIKINIFFLNFLIKKNSWYQKI